MPKFVRVSVNIAQISDTFDYSAPTELEGALQPGSLVIVPFGRQEVQGIVLRFIEEPAVSQIKAVESLVDLEPALTPDQLKLAEWMAEQNLSSVSECLDNMLPPGLSQHADTLIHLVDNKVSPEPLTQLQQRILTVLSKRGDLRGRQMDAALPKVNWRESLPGLVKRGLAVSQPILPAPAIRARMIRTAELTMSLAEATEQLNKTSSRSQSVLERRTSVLTLLARETGAVTVAMIMAETTAKATDLQYLAGLGLITIGQSEVMRDPLAELQPAFRSRQDAQAGRAQTRPGRFDQ